MARAMRQASAAQGARRGAEISLPQLGSRLLRPQYDHVSRGSSQPLLVLAGRAPAASVPTGPDSTERGGTHSRPRGGGTCRRERSDGRSLRAGPYWTGRTLRITHSLARLRRIHYAEVFKRSRTVPAEYARRLQMTGREWLLYLYEELTERETHWMGVRALKNPLDVWVYQEILHELRPDCVVELGSAYGGSALFFAHMLDLLGGEGQVVTVDHAHSEFRAKHPRIVKVSGDTRDPDVIERTHLLAHGRKTLLIHDAAHETDAVLTDLRNYADIVSEGSYLIVEDGVRDLVSGETGPMLAVERFLREDHRFQVDETRELFLLTYNPQGFLRRVR
jgi:cephalosporin hydroxylase